MARKKGTDIMVIKNGVPVKPKEFSSETLEESIQKSVEYTENAMEKFDPSEIRGRVSQWISDNTICPIDYFVERKMSVPMNAENIKATLETLKEITKIINKKTPFSPTIYTFAQLAGRSVENMKRLTQLNDERGEQMRIVYDYISECLLQGATSGDIPQIPALFIAKATLGMRETDSGTQINIITQGETSVEQIMNEYSNKIKLFEKKD